mmetsp:Transcript_19860/g.46186  ORF Transcript_19860/g.46186 Transcript_19860/m.46186 type:complete len:99 (-) Transcript_19860:7-303(-)
MDNEPLSDCRCSLQCVPGVLLGSFNLRCHKFNLDGLQGCVSMDWVMAIKVDPIFVCNSFETFEVSQADSLKDYPCLLSGFHRCHRKYGDFGNHAPSEA